ncbi:magnesium-translocating P-type ATPase [Candidatus Pacearchaeota archaeon]|nr:magnesium-translocating P-type ATPase [Candidatus Pacearchaeota archaeon]
MVIKQNLQTFWQIPITDLLEALETSPKGLTNEEANVRLKRYGPNLLARQKKVEGIALFLRQFRSPIILILLFAVGLSLFLQDATDAIIIFVIIFVSNVLGFWQEHRASNAVKELLAMVKITTNVIRDEIQKEIPSEHVVPGDVVLLSAGSSIPADSVILESKDLFVSEAVLTGETYPVEKITTTLSSDTPLSKRINSLFMGTNVVSGNGKALVVKTGIETEFGKVSERLRLSPLETEFERGVKRFGYFLMQVTLVLVIAIFAINVYFSRPVLESFLFALALAVGLTPQLLPAIISVNLSHGARRMATQKVIVKRLSSIENFGSMNILCSDKTGTLTEGEVHINSTLDMEGNDNQKVLFYAYLNASYETGFTNPIDEAIRTHKQFDKTDYKKIDEVPYDFIRKRLTIMVSKNNEYLMITKGALLNILSTCSFAETHNGIVDINQVKEQILQRFENLAQQGFRALGISYKIVNAGVIKKEDEIDMIFLGFLVLHDPPKEKIFETITQLKNLGVSLKIITGDNKLVAAHLGKQIELINPKILTGTELRHMSDDALYNQVNSVDIFSDVEPNQKERIIMALKKSGNVVGCMGDGINDAPALHAADVGISVNTAVDVAKEAADIVLLEKDLGVLVDGVQEGRRTFANTLKYVFMATSANFGNMFSMAGVSVFISFLPLLPKQILLTNLLTDFPEMTIATDNVDRELVSKPRKWDVKFIRRFMITFGILSSVFDFLTFAALLILGATVEQFRTGWFLESVISASLIVLVVRTRQPFFKSKPGRYLSTATLVIICVTILIPFTKVSEIFGFGTLPPSLLLVVGTIVAGYVISAEIAKKIFYRKVRF